MKITYQDITVEVDIAPIFFDTTSWLRSRWSNDPLRRMRDPVGLVSSRLFALRQGTTFRDPQGVWDCGTFFTFSYFACEVENVL